jgi:hypothetical protein
MLMRLPRTESSMSASGETRAPGAISIIAAVCAGSTTKP